MKPVRSSLPLFKDWQFLRPYAQARKALSIKETLRVCSPAPRVIGVELRAQGYDI